MLSFFRRLINSRVGIIVTFVALAVIALAFAAGDVTGLRNGSGGLAKTSIATVGKTAIGVAEYRQRAQNELEAAQAQNNQPITMAQFIAAGGLDATLERMINGLALEQFGHDVGMAVGKRSVDGQIASIAAFQGADGKFQPALYQQALAGRHLTDAAVREDIARQTLSQQLIVPTIGASQVPEQLALPYASLLLEKRHGTIAAIPAKAMATGPAPSDAEVQAFYARQIAHYSLPERRVMRYAIVTPDSVKAQATPSDAEVQQAYAADRAQYAPSEKRTISQVAVLDQAAAAALAAKVRAGTPIAEAARAAGLEPRTLTTLGKAGYAAQTSSALADAVFGAAKGAVVGPVKGPIGFVIAHVDAVVQDPGKTLEQARSGIAATLTKQKTLEAMGRIHDALDDASNGNATFDELVADQKLSAQKTAALTTAGVDPTDPAAKPDPALAQVVAAGFAAEAGDPPQLVQTGADGSFALVGLDHVVAAAPRPLAEVRASVMRDLTLDRANRAARKVAAAVLARIEHGATLGDALAQAGVALPKPQTIDASRAELANPRGAPPPLVMLFSMAAKTAKVLPIPGNAGWFVVYLSAIDKGDALRTPAVVASTRADLGRVLGREYVEQFGAAVLKQIGVKKNAAAIAKVKSDLSGGGAGDQP